jgi:hypothetical protein
MKRHFIVLLTMIPMAGCSAVDTSPIGGGLAVVGLALIVAAVINTLAGKGGDDE